MKELLKRFYKKYYSWIIAFLLTIVVCLIAYVNYRLEQKQKKIDEIEYTDSTGTYNKVYLEQQFSDLKKQNRELYDSLKKYKDQIDYIVQFTHKQEYHTGVVTTKPIIKDSVVYDTVPFTVPQVARTYEYQSEEADTFQYKLNVNSYTEPLWYSLDVRTKNTFTIVNKEEGGTNVITIDPSGGQISDVTTFKKKKRTFWDRFAFGPSVTAGYDVVNKNFGIMVGGSATFDLTK